MLKKLLKHEFRATARIFAPVFGATLILSGISLIVVLLGGILVLPGGTGLGSPIFGLFSGILLLLTILALFALMVCAMLVTLQRFYKNLLGDEGYLMFSLPVTPAQHIAAKLIVGTIWSAAALVLVLSILTALVCSVPGAAGHGLTLSTLFAAFRQETGLSFGVFLAVFFGIFVAGMINSYLLAFLSMAIGSRRQESRLFSSIAAYVVLSAALTALSVLCVFVFAALTASLGVLQTLVDHISSLPPFNVVCIAMGVSSCILLIGSAIYFSATRAILTKRLNLA